MSCLHQKGKGRSTVLTAVTETRPGTHNLATAHPTELSRNTHLQRRSRCSLLSHLQLPAAHRCSDQRHCLVPLPAWQQAAQRVWRCQAGARIRGARGGEALRHQGRWGDWLHQ